MGHTIQDHCCTSDTFWIYVVVILCLLLFSGLMSGLTLGLMSLGLVDLEVIKESGTPEDRMNAAKIIPVVRRQHLLLVTLLVGNAMAMEALPLFLDSLVDTWLAILLSVTLLLMFGEILPQAICTRYGLAVGATMAPLVRVLLIIIFPIAWPVSKVLDKILGKENNNLFRRAELITLVHMHSNEAGKGGELSRHETNLIAGTLELAGKTAADAMTAVASVVSINAQIGINDDAMFSIVASGHSRIPVYFGRANNIFGLIFVKNFLHVTVDQQSNFSIIDVPIRKIQRVSADMPLHDVLYEFCQRRSHMAVVVSSTTSFQKKMLSAPSAESTAKMVHMDVKKSSPTSFQNNHLSEHSAVCAPKTGTATGSYTESRCASADRTEDQAEHTKSEEANAVNENGAQRSSNNFTAPNLGDTGEEQWALRTGEEGEEIVGIITREDVLEELLKESLNLHKADTKVTIVDDQKFMKVSDTEACNSDPTSLSTHYQPRPPGSRLATKFQSMDEAEFLSVSDLPSNIAPLSSEVCSTETLSDSSFTCESPNELRISLSCPPTTLLHRALRTPRAGTEQLEQQSAFRSNEGVQPRAPTSLGVWCGQETPAPISK